MDGWRERIHESQSMIDDNNSKNDAWSLISHRLQEILDREDYKSWIEPLRLGSRNGNEINILVPNLVFYQTILDRYLESLEYAKSTLGLGHILLRFEVDGAHELTNSHGDLVETSLDQNFQTPQTPEPEEDTGQLGFSRSLSRKSNLNPKYTFETYVRGESNQFAHATCSAVADNPGHTYNPLFIYGSTGLGKTHLLHAVGARVLQRYPETRVIYTSSERFMNELIYCLRFNKMWDFRKKYRSCDLFLVDDVQFISHKERTQEEFFHTFNSLYEAKKQIVMTSDLFPQDIPDIEDRLRNRFQWGLIADIQPPSVEHRVAILMNKADHLGIRLSEDVALFISQHVKKNVRELEGALHRVAAFAALHGRTIDVELAAETFQNVLGDAPRILTVEMIQKTVADYYKVKVSDLKSKRRQKTLTIPRQIAMYLSRIRTSASFPDIGTRFGGKDHTTVMHAVKKIESDRQSDMDIKSSIEALERKLEQMS